METWMWCAAYLVAGVFFEGVLSHDCRRRWWGEPVILVALWPLIALLLVNVLGRAFGRRWM